MLVPIFPDQQLYSTCWPGVSTVPHKMSICTLAFLWIRLPWTKRKSLLYNSEIYWEWNTPTPGVPPVQAKQSVCEAEAIDSSCLQESKRNDFPLCKKKKKLKLKIKDKMDTTLSLKPPLNSPGFLITKQTSLYKHDGTAFAEILRHATASVTQIFYITYCVILDIGPRWVGLH